MATKAGAARSARAAPKPRGKGKPFPPGNPYRWQPGESGNPAGAKAPKISDVLREAMAQKMPANQRRALTDLVAADATIGQIIGFAVALRAAHGDLEAVEVIRDSTEGAPEQSVHISDTTGDDLARARARALAWEQAHLATVPAATDA